MASSNFITSLLPFESVGADAGTGGGIGHAHNV